ncbi:hypothetical protein UFOVP78_49 [uncultured Caudovirales phage]|uniref:Uncharacterized protein n=1 Tax=uncultured Caudovirales phage TaxID=2100421 RepID=A0A6J5KXG4_9CAUD|nr:hypothetical protein UFOVP78_49 [uncultured Caudovirales phage]
MPADQNQTTPDPFLCSGYDRAGDWCQGTGHCTCAELERQRSALAAVRAAVADYHLALDRREHGGVAQDRAVKAIEETLDMPWRQGEEMKRRAAT